MDNLNSQDQLVKSSQDHDLLMSASAPSVISGSAVDKPSFKWLRLVVLFLSLVLLGLALMFTFYHLNKQRLRQQYQEVLKIVNDSWSDFDEQHQIAGEFVDDEVVDDESCQQIEKLIINNQNTLKKLADQSMAKEDKRLNSRLKDVERSFEKSTERDRSLTEVPCLQTSHAKIVDQKLKILKNEALRMGERMEAAEEIANQYQDIAKKVKTEFNKKFFLEMAEKISEIVKITRNAMVRRPTKSEEREYAKTVEEVSRLESWRLSQHKKLRNQENWTISPLKELKDYLKTKIES